MSCKHDWDYKCLPPGLGADYAVYLVLCANCGKTAGGYTDEESARNGVRVLKLAQRGGYGFNRRARLARRERRAARA